MANFGGLLRRMNDIAAHYDAINKWARTTPQQGWQDMVRKNPNPSPPYCLPPYVCIKLGFEMDPTRFKREFDTLYRRQSTTPEFAEYFFRPLPPGTQASEISFVGPDSYMTMGALAQRAVDVQIAMEEAVDFPNNLTPEQLASLTDHPADTARVPNLKERIAASLEKKRLREEGGEGDYIGNTLKALSDISFVNTAAAATPSASPASPAWVNPTGGAKRKCDAVWGCGHYGATRTDKDGKLRSHDGQDYLAIPGQNVVAVTNGTVTKFGHAYTDDLSYRIIDIETSVGLRARHFYVLPLPSLKLGSKVSAGSIIGRYQGLQRRYNKMPEHVHVEIIASGKNVDPNNYIP